MLTDAVCWRKARDARLSCAAAVSRAGDYDRFDSDEPAADGRLVAVRDPGRGGETVVRLLAERTVDAGNETDHKLVRDGVDTPK